MTTTALDAGTSALPRTTRRGALARHSAHLAVRSLRALWRQPAFAAMTLVQPIIWLLLFGQLFRAVVDIPPAGSDRQPSATELSNAAQNPTNGPKENGNITRSPGPTRAAAKMIPQHLRNHAQLSAVSSHRSGDPPLPDVWWYRQYRAGG